MTRYPPGHKEQTRSRILRACRQHVHQCGLNAGLQGVMAEVGLTKGGFYTHFASKTSLLEETLSNALDEQRAEVKRRFDNAESDRDALESILDGYLSPVHLDDAESGCPIPSCLSDLSRSESQLRAPFNEYRQWLTDRVAEHLVGEPESSRQQVAIALVAMAIGAASLASVEVDPRERRRILAAARRTGRALIAGTNEARCVHEAR